MSPNEGLTIAIPRGALFAETLDLLDELGVPTRILPEIIAPGTVLGPLRPEVAAEVELGEAARALRTNDGIDPDGYAAMLPERRASHLLNVARAYTQVGELQRAAESLVEADRLAPNEVRCRPVAQELVVDLMRRTGNAPIPGLMEIVDQIGLSATAGAPRS